MPPFKLHAPYPLAGDQPEAVQQLVEGIQRGERAQVLLGVTGSGKTFTIANVIAQVQRPTLIISHNKTLTAQLYGEFKALFPENAVEYFVSYYDYYQPEAYIPEIDLYIEKDASINEEIDKLRLKAVSALLSGRRDVIVVATVSCIYGLGNPSVFRQHIFRVHVGQFLQPGIVISKLIQAMYSRVSHHPTRGTFRVVGDTIDIFPPYAEHIIRLRFFGNELDSIEFWDIDLKTCLESVDATAIFPATMYLMPEERKEDIFQAIERDLEIQIAHLKRLGRETEARRLEERVRNDIEMMRTVGYCKGIENYSRYFDGRQPGERPFCLLDYFPEDFLLVIDESHVTIPQLRSMYEGDRSRKERLVEYGFRLPAALDNRPLKFSEFEELIPQVIFVSATPGDYELTQTGGAYVEQVVRPTGLLDPEVEVRPTQHQIDDLIQEIHRVRQRGERAIVTTLTRRFAEELAEFLNRHGIRARYLHAEIETLERVEILRDLRLGKFDVVVGVNLLREGLDLPEVSLVAILDADREGFLRSERSLTQIAGRAARNVHGKVILYADRITPAIERFLAETRRRRKKQMEYNKKHGITPQTVYSSIERVHQQTAVLDIREETQYTLPETQDALSLAQDPIIDQLPEPAFRKLLDSLYKSMMERARHEDFIEAIRLRNELFALEKIYQKRFGQPPPRLQKKKKKQQARVKVR